MAAFRQEGGVFQKHSVCPTSQPCSQTPPWASQQTPLAAQEHCRARPPSAASRRLLAEETSGSFVFGVPPGPGGRIAAPAPPDLSDGDELPLPFVDSPHKAPRFDEGTDLKDIGGGAHSDDVSFHHLGFGTGSSSSGDRGGNSSGSAAQANSSSVSGGSGRMRWASASSSARGSLQLQSYIEGGKAGLGPLDKEWAMPRDDDGHGLYLFGSGAPLAQSVHGPGLGSEFGRREGGAASSGGITPPPPPIDGNSQALRCSVFGLPSHPAAGFADELPTNETVELSRKLNHAHSLLQSLYVSMDPSVQHRQAQAAAARSIMHTRREAPSSGALQRQWGGKAAEV